MTLSRRRFIAITAAAVGTVAGPSTAAPRRAQEVYEWTGRALGADVSIELYGGSQAALDESIQTLRKLEASFSLFDPASELARLNAAGRINPSADLRAILAACDTANRLTFGLFDPTIQAAWRATADGKPIDPDTFGWHQVSLADTVELGAGQSLTLNGIAQGFITDRVREVLDRHGLTQALINIGEHSAIGGPFKLAIADPTYGYVGHRSLRNGAIATSSPRAMHLKETTHIMHPDAKPVWSTVSVEAATAARADALSTAMCLMTLEQVWIVARLASVKVILVDEDGDLMTV